ncbi:MAG: ABC transporter permease, partial [Hyphomicrobium sp.]
VQTPQQPRPARRIIAVPGKCLLWVDAVVSRHYQNVITALVQIWANKARAMLTTLGMIIAVTSTITVVSCVQGFGNYVTDMLRGFGTNLMFVVPHRPSGFEGRRMGRVFLDVDDVRAVVARCDKVRRISPLIFGGATVEYGREKIEANEFELRGATGQLQSIRNLAVEKGRFFGPIDVDTGAYVCVVGPQVLRLLECDDKIVDDYVYINGLRFRVLGLLEHRGDMFGETQDDLVIIPYTTALKMFPFSRRFLAFAMEATSEEDVEEAALQVSRVLRERHNLQPGQPNDFRLFRQDEFLKDFERVKIIATSVLAGIVGISLIVGGIGIMNVMLVSVTERTREIGLRKSVGGRRRDILFQFLTEAVVLSTLGGLIGIALGCGICAVASQAPDMVAIPVPPWVIVLALGFSASVGITFGMIPAFKAAILHPIDALRYE